nr:hypothetical protein [Tanacetum cinerariifolium]
CNLPGSGFSFLLAVATFFTSSGNFFCQWELYTWQWECLVHFIPDNQHPSPCVSCLMLTLEGFPFITVNTKEYRSECSGNYHKDNA